MSVYVCTVLKKRTNRTCKGLVHAQGLYGLVSRKTNLEPLQPQLLDSVTHTSADVPGQCHGTSILDPHFSCETTTLLILSSYCPVTCM